MTSFNRFQLCLKQAREIVAAHRAEAPEGCDPQGTWVAIGVGVAGMAVSAGTSMYQQSQQKKAAAQQQKNASSMAGGIKPLDFPKMPKYEAANPWLLEADAIHMDTNAYALSDRDFAARHPELLAGEKTFEHNTEEDQRGDHTFIPQMQREAVTAGLGSALDAFGDAGPVLARGSGAEAGVARNLGLSVMGFQDRNRQNAAQSLTLAEQIFPRRKIGLSGTDATQINLGNISAKNAWNQANYAATVEQMEFNQKIAAGNAATQIQSSNANAQAQANLGAAQAQMYGSMAQSALSTAGTAYGNYQASRPVTTSTYAAGSTVPSTTTITARG